MYGFLTFGLLAFACVALFSGSVWLCGWRVCVFRLFITFIGLEGL